MSRMPPRTKDTASRKRKSRSATRMPVGSGRSCLPIAPGDAVIRSLKTSETVARDVVHDIVSLGLQSGDRMPAESAMLEQYGVSRESLREGLRLLEAQGLITIRRGPGGGPVVGHIDPANLGRIATLYYHLAGATYAELFDAWTLSESLLAEFAARNTDTASVQAAMAPYLTASNGQNARDDAAEFVRKHAGFHATVASLVNNRVLELMLQTTGQIVTHHVAVTADPRDVRELIERDHERLARAIAAGHANRARSLMEEHIRNVAEFYGKRIGDQMYDYIEWR